MSYEFLSDLFLLVLLGLACARIFFIQIAHQDPLSVLPIIAFLLSILNLLAFGLSVFRILIFILALVVTLWNSNALSRFNHKLVVDHYGFLFSLSSIIHLILIIVLAVFVILLHPAKIDTKKYGVTITSEVYAGSTESGFSDYTSPSQKRSLFIKKYTSKDKTANPFPESRTIIFVPGELSAVDFYEPFFVKLARDGYTVYAADFFADDTKWFSNIFDFKPFRRFVMLFCKEKNQGAYNRAINQKDENFVKEVLALIKQVSPSKSDKVFVVGDGQNQTVYATIRQAEKNRVRATFDLSSIQSYSTPGYGPIESTDPFLAKYLGFKRDGSFYMSSHIAGILEKSINDVMAPAVKAAVSPKEDIAENPDEQKSGAIEESEVQIREE